MNMSVEILSKIGMLYIFALVFALAFRILMMLGIGYSCKARAAKNQTGWMVLTFFFPIIAAFAFLCVKDNIRKKAPKLCVNCGVTVHPDTIACPNCGNAVFQNYAVTEEARYKKTGKILIIISIITCIVSLVFSGLTLYKIIDLVPSIDENSDSFGYYDNFDDDYYDDDYFEDYLEDYFENYFN